MLVSSAVEGGFPGRDCPLEALSVDCREVSEVDRVVIVKRREEEEREGKGREKAAR